MARLTSRSAISATSVNPSKEEKIQSGKFTPKEGQIVTQLPNTNAPKEESNEDDNDSHNQDSESNLPVLIPSRG